MQKQDIKQFFNELAPSWDEHLIHNDTIISTILDNAGVKENSSVLDIACGTGVLIPDYLSRGVSCITGVDISEEMIKIARKKYDAPNIRFICADAENISSDKKFDCIVIYNALPHFEYIDTLIERLSKMLKSGGTLTAAHSMSREEINRHHQGCARQYSRELPEAEKIAEIFSKYLRVTVCTDNDSMYQVCAVKE